MLSAQRKAIQAGSPPHIIKKRREKQPKIMLYSRYNMEKQVHSTGNSKSFS